MEKIAGLNFHSFNFNPTEVFMEILLRFLSQKSLLLMSSTYIHGKTFTVLLITTKNENHGNVSPFMVYMLYSARNKDLKLVG